jgi:hypothetical protein
MTNKQVMKVSVMQIGFSVISIGMMLIVLGINSGGVKGAVEGAGLKFDFKTGSTGVAVFLVGAVMATAGGVLKNKYKTGVIPKYISEDSSKESEETIAAYNECKSQKITSPQECFIKFYERINQDKSK